MVWQLKIDLLLILKMNKNKNFWTCFFSRDGEGVAALVQEVFPTNSVLVFCPTKKSCETTARMLASIIQSYVKGVLFFIFFVLSVVQYVTRKFERGQGFNNQTLFPTIHLLQVQRGNSRHCT